MSQKGKRNNQRAEAGSGRSLETLYQIAESSGPGDPPGDHDHTNDHIALLYEHWDEQFASAIPFIRDGLERGEQCIYVADDNSRTDVLAAMRAYDIDVDAVLESGALSVLTPAETYRRTGSFDRDAMLEFWTNSLEQAKQKEEYTGVRAAAEMTWALNDETGPDELVEYEAVLNPLYAGEDYTVLCQYNRERFSPEVIRDVIKTHPHIVVDNTISQNFYYTPPEQFFDSEDPETKVNRMTQTLQEHTAAKTELHEHKEYLRELYDVTAGRERSFEEKLEQLLDLGCEWFGLDMAGLNSLPSWDGEFRLEESVGIGVDSNEEVWTNPEEGCFCRRTITEDRPVSRGDVRGTDWVHDSIHQKFGVTSYLGMKVTSGSTPYGTLWFGSTEPREREFSEAERTSIELMSQWVSYEIERQEHQQAQKELYEITADGTLTFDEKADRLLDLGRDRFDLDVGFLLEKQGEEFGVVKTRGTDLEEGVATVCANPGHYCEQTISVDGPVGVENTEAAGWDDDPLYREYDVGCYLGTRVTVGDDVYGSVCFADSSARKQTFTDTEYTFLDLIGQWLRYELERQQREQELREQTEHLQAIIETAPECIKTVAPDGTLLQMNSAGLEMGEAEAAEDVVGECVYDLVAPEDRDRYRDFNERICRGARGTLAFDIIGLEGTRRQMETHAAPLEYSDGRTVQVALTRDITEQVEREQQLEKTVEQLEQSNDRLKQFAYAASHDLQEPLRMVSSYLQLLEKRYRDDLDDDAEEYIDFAVDGADRMRAMVDDLLAFSRVEQADGTFEPVDCNSVLDRVTDDLQITIEETDAEISAEELPTIRADYEQLEQLFSNLVSNAIKYNDDESPEVEITAEERVDHWEFAVADNGIGINPEKSDRIFEVFKRLHHENEYPGTGIGLSMCQEILENHGGDIWVDSDPGEGSTFFVTIPRRATV